MTSTTNTTHNARVRCAISGISFEVAHLGILSIPVTTGYYHPVFCASYTDLHKLYTAHCAGDLTSTESYLVFLAFLHSSGKVQWNTHCSLNPLDANTVRYVENNMAQLLEVIEKSACITHPEFIQPVYVVNKDNSDLATLKGWMQAWKHNTNDFVTDRRQLIKTMQVQQELQAVEDKLSRLILAGEKPEKCAATIANWADKAAIFPEDKAEGFKLIIRSCFNVDKMFKTPLADIKEVKEYCELNIVAGSIHFHALFEALRAGIKGHTDYLGGSTLALGYKILVDTQIAPSNPNNAAVPEESNLLEEALTGTPDSIGLPPKREDYASGLEHLKARLAYKSKVLAYNQINGLGI